MNLNRFYSSIRLSAFLLLAGSMLWLSGCTMPDNIKAWDRKIKSQPAGVGIQGAAIVEGLFIVLKKYAASEQQVEEAKRQARQIVEKLPEEQKASLKENPMILVEVKADDRASQESKVSMVIFDTSSETVVGNRVYDVKVTPKAQRQLEGERDVVQTKLDDFKVQYFGLGSY
jgi:hypothetical protein